MNEIDKMMKEHYEMDTLPADRKPISAQPEPTDSADTSPRPQSAVKPEKGISHRNSTAGSWKKNPVLSQTEDPAYIRRSPMRSWFNTFMIMNIPIIGWIYLLILAFGKKDQRKDFAKAYLVYKLVFLLVALAILAVLLYVGMDAADHLLEYMDML